MSGQNSAMLASQDSLGVVWDTLKTTLFEVSELALEVVQVEGDLNFIQRVLMAPPDWFFLYLLILFGLFVWIRHFYGNIFMQTIQAATNFQVATRMFKDNSVLQKQLDNMLYAFYFLCGTLLLIIAEKELQLYPYNLEGIGLYLFNLGLLAGVFFARLVLVNLSGFLFNRIRIYREYLYNSFIFNKLLGLITMPLLLLIVYTSGYLQEVFQWITLAAVVIITGMRVIRGVIFTFKKDVLIFYLFLYLCALEIVPLALLYKWLQGIL